MKYTGSRLSIKINSRFIILLLIAAHIHLYAQELDLETCQTLAKQNYPLIKEQKLITKSGEYSLANIAKGRLPQVGIYGQASYQSEVMQFPLEIPGTEAPTISKDQYKIYGEVVQPLTELFTIKQQEEAQRLSTQMKEQNIEVELYKIRERVNQLYFSILLADEQKKQNELLKSDIHNGLKRVKASIENGTDVKISIDKLQAELLRAEQKDMEIKVNRRALLDMLSLFINQNLADDRMLTKPASVQLKETIARPEIKNFDLQKQNYKIQNKLITARSLPKFSLFLQAGFGKPSPLNMLSADFSSYYIGGLRLNWSLSNYYTMHHEKQLILNNMASTSVQQEVFLLNTRIALQQQNGEVEKLKEFIKSDLELVSLRQSIKQNATTQLENGIITTNDYLREVNAENLARQQASLHEIQLLMAQYNFNYTSGN